eukprot:Skav224233  [mRNA]  locus=scaffold939:1244722:1244970:+ [translate_table: standard]
MDSISIRPISNAIALAMSEKRAASPGAAWLQWVAVGCSGLQWVAVEGPGDCSEVHSLAGAFAGAAQTAFWHPLDVLKTRSLD